MLELRQAKWVARREEAGPKTIEQIHKDAAMDAMKKSLEASDPGPPPSRLAVLRPPCLEPRLTCPLSDGPPRRSEDRGDRRRSQTAHGPRKERQQPKENQVGPCSLSPGRRTVAAAPF